MVIIGLAEFAEMDLPDDSPVKNNIHKIIASGKRAGDLVRSMLTYIRQTESILHLISPHLIVKEVLEMFRSSLPATIEIREEIDKESGHILADTTNIHQIIMNLLTNAKHAMEGQEGTLTIRVYSKDITAGKIRKTELGTGSFVVISVGDTGRGMDQTTIDRIFDPYFTTKRIGKGTGLGLSVIQGIVQKLKGCIQVESVPGGGSTFDVYLPKFMKEIASDEESASERSETMQFSSSGKEKILVVDDEHLIVDIYKRQLEQNGYSVTTVTDSRDALNLFREQPDGFDLLITDLNMPKMSGFELSQAVCQIRPGIPIIMCSGHKDLLFEEDVQEYNIKKFVSKPLAKENLLAAVRQVLDEN
jgi:CheY-like chemotaxis protein